MHCPRCAGVVLDELDRNGVTVDRCANCRGIWLDRGELEKLIARATAELEDGLPARPTRQYATSHHHGRDDREPPSSQRRHGQRHHRSFWHDLFD
jgi:uncharacterized protein